MNPATLGRCEVAIYLFALILLTVQVAEDCGRIIAAAVGL